MADMILTVDTAVIVPVNLMPLVDDTDFKTIEAAVAYNAAGMDLRWNFVTAAGVQSSTAVTPTTAGVYDWTHLGDGIYSMEIPASGGASANNDTEGFGWWSGVVTGVLPFRGPVIQFSPANVMDSLVTGSDRLQVHMAEITNDLITAAAIANGAIDAATFAAGAIDAAAIANNAIDAATFAADVDAEILSYLVDDATRIDASSLNTASVTTIPAILVDTAEIGVAGAGLTNIGTIATVTNLTNLPAITANWLTAAGLAADAVAEIQSGLSTLTQTQVTGGAYALNSASFAFNAAMDFTTTQKAATLARVTLVDTTTTNTDMRGTNNAALATDLATVAGYLDTEIAAILADTNELQTDWANGGRLDLILDATATQTSVNTIDDLLDTEIAAIKAKTDQLTFTVANQVDSNALSGGGLDAAATRTALGLASANLDTQLAAIDDFLDTEVGAIKTVTDAIGATGSGLSAIPWNAAWDTEVQSECTDALNAYDPPTNAEMEARTLVSAGYATPTNITAGTITTVTNLTNAPTVGDLTAAMIASVTTAATAATPNAASVTGAVGSVTGNVGGNVTGSIGSLAAQAKADVNAEVLDVLNVDTFAEPTGVPAATTTLAGKIGRIYQALRNKLTVTSTKKTFHDDTEAALWEQDVSDDGTTYTQSEGNSI